MIKILMKRQLQEIGAFLYQNNKTGKRRSKGSIALYILLLLLLYASLSAFFFYAAHTLCGPLVAVGMGWLYFALMGLISIAMGIFGSIFNTFSGLYQAKDNELLLSMPIPPSCILISRLSGAWLIGLLFESVVMLPALICYGMAASSVMLPVLFCMILTLVLSFLILALSCILGWGIAVVSSRLKHKSFFAVFLALAFIVVYYYFYSKAYQYLQLLLENSQAVGSAIKRGIFPVYQFGLAATGDLPALLIFTGMTAALAGIVYWILSRSFLKIVTTNRGAAKIPYKERALKSFSVSTALLRKEWKRFTSSPTYMLNCGLGTFLIPVCAVFILLKGEIILTLISIFPPVYDARTLLACSAICLMTSMNNPTAPSVSLEGKTIWIVQTLPLSGWQPLQAKLRMHVLLTVVPTLLCIVCAVIVLRPAPLSAILMTVLCLLYILFGACFGLALNLKVPNLTWTSETTAVKQNTAALISLFGSWVIVMGLSALYLAARRLFSPTIYLLLCTAVLFAACVILLRWLRTRGAQIFEHL